MLLISGNSDGNGNEDHKELSPLHNKLNLNQVPNLFHKPNLQPNDHKLHLKLK